MSSGLDTGFFVKLLAADPAASAVWDRFAEGVERGVVSCLTLYELEKLGLSGRINRARIGKFLEDLPEVCEIVWITESDLPRQAARIAHGTGLAMADAIILVSLLQARVEVIYTSDADFARYPGVAIRRV